MGFVHPTRPRESRRAAGPAAGGRGGACRRFEDGGDLKRVRFVAGLVLGLVLGLAVALPSAGARAQAPSPYEAARESMVRRQIEARGIRQPEVLAAMAAVPRHRFVPPELRSRAYDDAPLPIGEGQTISQPYVVALMTELLDLDATSKVLEIGTGSGYHAAVMSRIASRVVSMEIVEPLADRARDLLTDLGYRNVQVRAGDGSGGLPSEGPYDAIVLTVAPREVPSALVAQLRIGGRLVAPIGEAPAQDLVVLHRTPDGLVRRNVAAVRFVPMTTAAEPAGARPPDRLEHPDP